MPQEYSENESGTGFENEIEIELPPECEVIFYNDNYTTMEFVTEVLMEVFEKSEPEADALMLDIHNNGSAVVGVYTYDIAVTKAGITTSKAKKEGFPLRVEVKLQ